MQNHRCLSLKLLFCYIRRSAVVFEVMEFVFQLFRFFQDLLDFRECLLIHTHERSFIAKRNLRVSPCLTNNFSSFALWRFISFDLNSHNFFLALKRRRRSDIFLSMHEFTTSFYYSLIAVAPAFFSSFTGRLANRWASSTHPWADRQACKLCIRRLEGGGI